MSSCSKRVSQGIIDTQNSCRAANMFLNQTTASPTYYRSHASKRDVMSDATRIDLKIKLLSNPALAYPRPNLNPSPGAQSRHGCFIFNGPKRVALVQHQKLFRATSRLPFAFPRHTTGECLFTKSGGGFGSVSFGFRCDLPEQKSSQWILLVECWGGEGGERFAIFDESLEMIAPRA